MRRTHTLAGNPRSGWTWASSSSTDLTHLHTLLIRPNQRPFRRHTSSMDADEQLARQLQVCCLVTHLRHSIGASAHCGNTGTQGVHSGWVVLLLSTHLGFARKSAIG